MRKTTSKPPAKEFASATTPHGKGLTRHIIAPPKQYRTEASTHDSDDHIGMLATSLKLAKTTLIRRERTQEREHWAIQYA